MAVSPIALINKLLKNKLRDGDNSFVNKSNLRLKIREE